MDTAISELPLAVFTTLAPIGAGAFVVLAVAFFTTSFSRTQLKTIDKLTGIPLIIILIGFAASFAHLASPLHAIGVFSRIGSSPLSNEIAVGSLFVVVAVVYWIVALLGKLGDRSRKGFIVLVAVLGVLFAWFSGSAYMMDTIASWNTVAVSLSIVGFFLLGGTLLGTLVLSGAHALDAASEGEYKRIALGILLVGLALALIGVGTQFVLAASISNSTADGSLLASAMQGYLVFFVVCAILSALLGCFAFLRKESLVLLTTSCVIATAGIFVARLVFYSLQISVGLQ
jgi:DMSO reductase anchor subunit